jgi:SAM-dependent methyltransferase
VARLLSASALVDRTYRRFDRLRSELVASLASDETLDRFNELAYGGTPRYQPDSAAFHGELFPFEERVIDEFFPRPPARILLGGAGGGREAFALAERGYDVVAFEPAQSLVAGFAAAIGTRPIEVRRGSYEELAQLLPDDTFDAAIFGWSSFSHLRNDESRLEALRQYRRLTGGPILVSFLALKSEASSRLTRLRRILPRRPGRDPADVFALTIGLYHPVDEEEVRTLAERAGLRVVELNFDERETSWPHVVLQRAG